MKFAAIDVETANPDYASICQIGIAVFNNNQQTHEWTTYVDPEDNFSKRNIEIHNITQQTIIGAPKFPAIIDEMSKTIANRPLVCFSCFDRLAIQQAFAKYILTPPAWRWIDCARIARHVWTGDFDGDFTLVALCEKLGYSFKHHDALEDAKAAGQLFIAALPKLDVDITDWETETEATKKSSSNWIRFPSHVKCEGNPAGPLHGHVIVFTGKLRISREEAARTAAALGCNVADAVTKKTTLLVVGDQDIRLLAGHETSQKHRRAQELISQGYNIKILRESDFDALTRLTTEAVSSGN